MNADTGYLLALIGVTGGVTLLLRAFPFLLFGRGRKAPELIRYLGTVLSPAAIAMLCVYCFACYFRDRPPLAHGCGAAELASAVLVLALQVWKRNALLSICA